MVLFSQQVTNDLRDQYAILKAGMGLVLRPARILDMHLYGDQECVVKELVTGWGW